MADTTKDIWNDNDGEEEQPRKPRHLRNFLIFFLTLAVVLGVPFVCFMLTLMPFIRETTAALESGTDGQIMAMGFEWMQWLARVARFVTEQWQWVQLGGAAVSLPLSYLCMRTTPQP